MTVRLLLVLSLSMAAASCAAPMDENEEDSDSTESAVAKGGFACPTNGAISQGFNRRHDGVDLAAKRGTPIFAVAAGVVTESGSAQGYGQWIVIRHDDGTTTEYGHMYRREVKAGARVRAGQRIARMGSEGRSTGPHLHLRTYASGGNVGPGRGMSPITYLKRRGISLPCKPGASPAAEAVEPVEEAGTDGDVETVTAWTEANVRSAPTTDARVLASVRANTRYTATCWTAGELVQAEGRSHDRWVKLTAAGREGFVSGIFLEGNERGGVSEACDADDD